MNTISIAIHGGAGTLVKGIMTPEKEKAYQQALQKALEIGYQVFAMPFNTEGMYRGVKTSKGIDVIAIY